MADYQVLFPSAYSIQPPQQSDTLSVYTSNSDKVKSTETVDVYYNTIPSLTIEDNLHSLLQNTFYTDFVDVIKSERKDQREKLYLIEKMFSNDAYFGDYDEYRFRMIELLRVLDINITDTILNSMKSYYYVENHTPPVELIDPIDVRTQWFKDFTENSYILKSNAGAIAGYSYLFRSIYHNGFVFLRSAYPKSIFSTLTNKYFRVLDFFAKDQTTNRLFYNLPSYPDSIWPISKGITAVQSYDLLQTELYYKYDTSKIHDNTKMENSLPVPDYEKYDNTLDFNLEGKGHCLEINADIILTHDNSLGTKECLMDTPWLEYMSGLLPFVKRATTDVMIGTQITLVAQNTGRYYSNLQKQVNEEDGAYYTHPNIKAKFQVYPDVWVLDTEIGYIQVGDGTPVIPTDYFNDHDDPSLISPPPTGLVNPLFENAVSTYEINEIQDLESSYKSVSIILHPLRYEKEVLSPNLFINQVNSTTPVSNTITFPTRYIADNGKSEFIISMVFEASDGTFKKRSIYLKEKFYQGLWELIPSIYETNEDGSLGRLLAGEFDLVPSEYIEETNFTNDYSYISSSKESIIEINSLSFDRKAGTLTISIQVDPNSILGNDTNFTGTGTILIGTTVQCTYSTNFNVTRNSNVAITEVGVFNLNNEMVAYGNFPPIIYDPNNYHLSFNMFLELPA